MADVGTVADSAVAAPEERVTSGTASPGQTTANTEIRKIGKHTLVYAIGVGLAKLTGLIMLPVYTRALTPADYGVLELLTMTIDLIGMVVGIGIAASVFKFHAEASGQRDKDAVISTAALSVITLGSAASAIGLLLSTQLTETLLGDAGRPIYFRIFFLIYFLQTAEAIPLLLLRVQHKSAHFVAVNVTKLACMLSLNIYFVVVLKMGVLGVLLSNLIVTSVMATVLSVYMFRAVGARFSRAKFDKMAHFGYPLVLWFVANFIVVFSNRYFLNHFVGPAGVGIYALAAKFAFVMSAFAFTPFQMIWDPQRFAIANRPDAAQIYRRVFFYFNLALAIIALGIGLFVFDVIRIIAAPAFRHAHEIVPLLLTAQIIFHWTAFANLGLFLRNKTHTLAMVAASGVLTVLLMNYLLIPRFGIVGAAIGAIVAYLVRFLTVYIFSQREYHIDYPWQLVGRLYGVVVAAVVVRQFVNHLTVGASITASAALAIVALAAIYRFVLTDTERGLVRRVIVAPRLILSFATGRS